MSREGLATIALRALPREVRASRGEEMIGTLLDASAGSRTRLVREIANLLRVGIHMRAGKTGPTTPRRLLADGFCRGAVMLMILDLSTLLSQRLDGVQDPLLSWTSIGVLGAILALALVGAERLAGIAALVWAAARFPELVAHNATFNGLAPTVVPLVCFTVLIVNPRRRRLDLRRVAWLLVPAALVAAYAPRGGNGPITALVSLAAILFVLVALLKIPTDPRLAIACALPATYVALMVAGAPAIPVVLLCFAAPLVMGVATIRLWRLPKSEAIC
jgi:hypothetical protein